MAQVPVVELDRFVEVLKGPGGLTRPVGLAIGVDEYLRGPGHSGLHGRILVRMANGQTQHRVD